MDQPKPKIEFPCDVTIKAMGLDGEDLEHVVLAIINKHVEHHHIREVSQKWSKNRKYLSITAKVTIESREQLTKVHADLEASERIIVVL